MNSIEDLLGEKFALISQNVDSLHKKAGNSLERTYLIHGDLDYVRCGDECSYELYPFPSGIDLTNRQKDVITDEEWKLLRCPRCGEDLRPHVLWFDETYNERFYRLNTVERIAYHTGVLFIIGTSGATFLPQALTEDVLNGDGLVVEVNVDAGFFTERLKHEKNGITIQSTSSDFLKELEQKLKKIVVKKS